MGPVRQAPLYRWLTETLREDISQGVYRPGDLLPPEHELMRRYDLSSTTVRRAVHELVSEGWIYRKAGKGTFVRRARVEEHLSRLTSFVEEMRSRNITPSFRLVCAKPCVPPADAARALNLTDGQAAFYIERVQLGNGEPIALARGYWRSEIGEQLARHDLDVVGLYEMLEETLRVPLLEADESISAAVADADLARKLEVQRRAPLVMLRRVSYSTDMRPVEHTTTFYRADRYEYKIRLAR